MREEYRTTISSITLSFVIIVCVSGTRADILLRSIVPATSHRPLWSALCEGGDVTGVTAVSAEAFGPIGDFIGDFIGSMATPGEPDKEAVALPDHVRPCESQPTANEDTLICGDIAGVGDSSVWAGVALVKPVSGGAMQYWVAIDDYSQYGGNRPYLRRDTFGPGGVNTRTFGADWDL